MACRLASASPAPTTIAAGCALVLVLGVWAPVPLAAAGGWATTVAPAEIPVGVSTPVLATVHVEQFVPANGLVLQRTDAAGITAATVGVMHDDGVNGDAVALDHTFSLRFAVTPTMAGPGYYRAFIKGGVVRIASAPMVVTAIPPGPSAMRANAYDDAWEPAWVAHGRALLATPGRTEGLVLEIGDSITHSRAYSAWAISGQGKTTADAQLTAWIHSGTWSGTETDAANVNGWYLTGADTTSQRGMTSASGLSTIELVTGCCNGGPTMPAAATQTTARQVVANPIYTANLRIDTLATAFSDAQFAVVMMGTNDRGDLSGVANLGTVVDWLEAAGILPILSTIPPRNDGVADSLNVLFNDGIRSMAQTRGLPLIDYYQEIVLRRPGTSWYTTLIGADGVHPTANRAGFTILSDPYLPGGDPTTGTTGDAAANVGYLLRSWLTVQKLKEVKRYVVDGVDVP